MTQGLLTPRVPPALRARASPDRRAVWWLAAVAAAFTAAQLLFVGPGLGLGWDETVYVSQVAPHIPAAYFSAPRARGVSALVAPLALLTSSDAALRVYLAVLSGAGLLLALRAWRRLRPVPVLVLAGLLFAGLWITQLYGLQAMPNLWIALSALAATGCFLRAATDRDDRHALAGLALCLALAALLRPSDAAWLALPMAAGALIVRRWRRPVLLAAIVAGLALGGAQWIVEAYVSYGGIAARLHRSNEIEGGLGWHLGFYDQLRTLAGGPLLCRPCTVRWRQPGQPGQLTASFWWFALPLLAVAGAWTARRRQYAGAAFPALCGLSVAAPYLLFIDYAAPRFLLPAYALLSVPVADFLVAAARPRRVGPRARQAATAVVAALVLAQLVSQHLVLEDAVRGATRTTGDYRRIAADLHTYGVRPSCLVTGLLATPVGYEARCRSGQISGHNRNMTRAQVLAAAHDRPVAVLVPPHQRVPSYARGWTPRRLTGLAGHRGYRVYLSPSTPAR